MKTWVLMSGGTTAVINCTLKGLIDCLEGEVRFGIDEVRAGETIDLWYTPASGVIGTFRDSSFIQDRMGGYDQVILIGGSGTFNLAREIGARYVPKTVDNDIGDIAHEKMYVTPGFISSMHWLGNTLHALDQDALGSRLFDPVFIVETFGRKSQYLARVTDYMGPQFIRWGESGCRVKVSEALLKYKRAVVTVVEGQWDPHETVELNGQIHYGRSPGTSGERLCDYLRESRWMKPGPMQRVLGAVEPDRQLAYMVGAYCASTHWPVIGVNRSLAPLGLTYENCDFVVRDEVVDFGFDFNLKDYTCQWL